MSIWDELPEAITMTERTPTADTKYDPELGRITVLDREYAAELVDDIEDDINDRAAQIKTATQWIRKVCYEAVQADRKKRALAELQEKMGWG